MFDCFFNFLVTKGPHRRFKRIELLDCFMKDTDLKTCEPNRLVLPDTLLKEILMICNVQYLRCSATDDVIVLPA